MEINKKSGRRHLFLAQIIIGLMVCFLMGCGGAKGPLGEHFESIQADEASIKAFCGHCHGMPPGEIFPRAVWKMEVERGFQFFEKAGLPLRAPPLPGVVEWYEKRAPEKLDSSVKQKSKALDWVSQELSQWPESPQGGHAISHLRYASITPSASPLLWATDMRGGMVCTLDPQKREKWKTVLRGNHPCHVEPGDFDGDGLGDVLVCELGSFLPTDARKGRAVWHRGMPNGSFDEQVILENVGRVTDIQLLSPPGVWPMEFVVAAFGWNNTGEVWYVRIPSRKADPKTWERNIVDPRHGAIHILVRDWNGDGKPDFVVLFGQEHECVTLYLNQGGGKFLTKELYQGGHPGLGHSGISQSDLDGDGDIDLLLTNGDVLDQPYLLKPYHSVSWMENMGELQFRHHVIGRMHGVHRALPLLKKDALLDMGPQEIVSVAFLPEEGFPQRQSSDLPSVLLWAPNKDSKSGLKKWDASIIESVRADHVTVEVLSGPGFEKGAVVVGDFSGKEAPVKLFKRK